MNLRDARIENGSIKYNLKVDARPETKETVENVTTINAAVEGQPAYYEVTFFVDSSFEESGLKFSNIFHLTCVVVEQNDLAPYRVVEDKAARQIAPMLRSLADKIETDLPTWVDNPT